MAQQSLTPHWGHRLRLKKEPKVRLSSWLLCPNQWPSVIVTSGLYGCEVGLVGEAMCDQGASVTQPSIWGYSLITSLIMDGKSHALSFFH